MRRASGIGATVASARADAWEPIETVVAAARRLSKAAESLLEKVAESADAEVRSDVRFLICGKKQFGGGAAAESEDRKAVWTCIRAAIADQFGGFAVRQDYIPRFIRSETFSSDGSEPDERFWRLAPDRSEPCDVNPARLWFLISYLNTILPELDLKHFCQILDWFELPAFFRHEQDDLRSSWRQWPWRFLRISQTDSVPLDRLRVYAVHSLATRLLEDLIVWIPRERSCVPKEQLDTLLKGLKDRLQELNACGIPGDSALQSLLNRQLRSGQASGLEVSLLLRTLTGCYLNRSPHPPSWLVEHISEGIAYVLRSQKRDGTWPDVQAESPLLHRFAPLLHVLDLPLEVLREHLERLIESGQLALASAQHALMKAERLWASGPSESETRVVFHEVVTALSLAETSYDRFKDLLSDWILTDLGAMDSETKLAWDAVPSSLGFAQMMDKYVIEEWKRLSRRRPGAILVFGPPGTGKTTIAELLVDRLNKQEVRPSADARWRLLVLTPGRFAREGADGVVACAEQIFGELCRTRRCVVLLDEMEEFLRVRANGSDHNSRLVTTAFLPLLQEAVRSREIILILATNFVGSIDPAVTRSGRFDLIVPLGPPDASTRKRLLRNALEESDSLNLMLAGVGDSLNHQLVYYTMGYTSPELSYVLELLRRHRELPELVESPNRLACALWQIRAANMPIALSGRPGCNWNVFADEVRRYSRPRVDEQAGRAEGHQEDGSLDYWTEPTLPYRGV